MPELRIKTNYQPLPRQEAFHTSSATVKGYGGAMGGGKSRALCEDVFQDMLDYPGILLPIFRLRHVSLANTTKKTMVNEVIPPELLRYCDRKQSGGEDYIRLPNGSEVHFVGLDDPVRWFSSELGGAAFDEAHEIPEESVVSINTRLRQRGMPGRMRFGFNPENPGHWLRRWFIVGGEKTFFPDGEYLGYRKAALYPTDAQRPIGSAEFIFAKATDNPYLPEGYVEDKLGGLPEHLRRRYLDGEWLFVIGTQFFDVSALAEYSDLVPQPRDRFDFEVSAGGATAKRRSHRAGKIRVYAEPKDGHTYAVGADVATGDGRDHSAAYVVDLTSMEFVAEFHGKLDQDLFAEQLHFLGRWYKTALLAVERAGGYGDAVIINLRDGKGGRPAYPKLYRHTLELQVDLPTTKRYGYPMTSATRPKVLGELAKALRERSLPFVTEQLMAELPTFVMMDTGTSPRAQDGCNDDCVIAAALALEMYRRKGHHPDREARIKGRRRVRERLNFYPWQEPVAA